MAALPDIDQGHVEGFFTGGLLRMLGFDGLRSMLAEFREGREVWKLRVRKDHQQIAAASQKNPSRMIEGVGQHRLRVDLEVYKYWQLRRPGCWNDKKFRDEFHRDNPECRVTSVKKARIIVPAGKYSDVRSAAVESKPAEAGAPREGAA
jgi:hypothetical protein